MKLQYSILAICVIFATRNLSGQTNHLFIPFLDRESQSNVLVTVWGDQPCPLEYTNMLSNTNLFTPEEQKIIGGVFVKYKNVATNSGPPGTVLTSLYETNYIAKTMDRMFTNELWVANFQYTNFEAHEEIRFGGGVFARYRNMSNDGYNASFTRTGDGTLLSFGEIKHDRIDGLFARFDDNHAQGLTWDYRLANFDGSCLEEYKHYKNKMIVEKYFMWNPRNGNLIMEAEFKDPYDFERHRTDLRMLQQHP